MANQTMLHLTRMSKGLLESENSLQNFKMSFGFDISTTCTNTCCLRKRRHTQFLQYTQTYSPAHQPTLPSHAPHTAATQTVVALTQVSHQRKATEQLAKQRYSKQGRSLQSPLDEMWPSYFILHTCICTHEKTSDPYPHFALQRHLFNSKLSRIQEFCYTVKPV